MHAHQTTKTYLGTAVLVLRVLFFLSAFHLVFTILLVLFRLCGAGLYKKNVQTGTLGLVRNIRRHTTYLDWALRLIYPQVSLVSLDSLLLSIFSTTFRLYCWLGPNLDSLTQPFLVLDSLMAASFPYFTSVFALSDRYLIAWWLLLSLNASHMSRSLILDFLVDGSFIFSRWLHINVCSATVISWSDFRFFFRFRPNETLIVLIPSMCIIPSKLLVAK